MRKAENDKETVRVFPLACIVLHNICIEQGDVAQRQWDLSKDPKSNQCRMPDECQDLLMIRQCRPLRDSNPTAATVRDYLKFKCFQKSKRFKELLTYSMSVGVKWVALLVRKQ